MELVLDVFLRDLLLFELILLSLTVTILIEVFPLLLISLPFLLFLLLFNFLSLILALQDRLVQFSQLFLDFSRLSHSHILKVDSQPADLNPYLNHVHNHGVLDVELLHHGKLVEWFAKVGVFKISHKLYHFLCFLI